MDLILISKYLIEMSIEDFHLIRLHENHNILPFDCGDDDLNDFLINDG